MNKPKFIDLHKVFHKMLLVVDSTWLDWPPSLTVSIWADYKLCRVVLLLNAQTGNSKSPLDASTCRWTACYFTKLYPVSSIRQTGMRSIPMQKNCAWAEWSSMPKLSCEKSNCLWGQMINMEMKTESRQITGRQCSVEHYEKMHQCCR